MQIKEIGFKYRAPVKEIIIPTDLMCEMENRTVAVQNLSGLVVWYGQAGAGKTTAAQWVRDRINSAFKPEIEYAFKSVFYEVGKVKTGSGNEAKQALRSLYRAVTGMLLDEGVYGRNTVDEIADLIIHAAKRYRIQLVFVDEAGLLSVDAISALILAANKAKHLDWLLNIVLIGMDDLAEKLSERKRPQIFRRVHDWCYFRNYDIDQTADLLRALHPHFAELNADNLSDWEQVKLIHEFSGGLPGFIVQFLSRFDAQYRNFAGIIDTRFLRAVHLRTVYDRRDILEQSKRNGAPLPENYSHENKNDCPAKPYSKRKNNASK